MLEVNNSAKHIAHAIDALALQVSRVAWAIERTLRSQLPSRIVDTLVACRRCGSMLAVAGEPKCGACGAEMEVAGG
jgi:uncharacterized paraquat-inducible protein A